MTWSSSLPVPPAQPVDPGLAASAAALLSALVREEPRPLAAGGALVGTAGAGQALPAQRSAPAAPAAPSAAAEMWSPAAVPADRDALPTEQARRRGVFSRR